jgi:preprotein translocase subunit SecA
MSSALADWYHRLTGARSSARLTRRLARINALEMAVRALSDAELALRYAALRQNAANRSVDARLEETFALVREAGVRALGLRAYDEQLLGGMVLAQGMLAEMKTGEGKTLAIAAPAALAALAGRGVHVVTANPYLARRDAATLAPLYALLGLSVGVAEPHAPASDKRLAYGADITYSVNYELGFDYLRDNMVRTPGERVQRGLYWAIVDEVDSILIDDARTPLVISGLSGAQTPIVTAVDAAFRELDFARDLVLNEKEGTASPSNAGYARLEQALVAAGVLDAPGALYEPEHLHVLVAIHAAARAWGLYRRDRHYVVQDGKVLIVDEGTGRLMAARRWGGGLHEALEAKERVAVQPQTRTEASITYQSFFGRYAHLAGLTGTAMTEADEFAEIYGLRTVAVPTHRPVVRVDAPDQVFATKAQKWAAVLEATTQRHAAGQPVLLGVASVGDAELLSRMFTARGLPHHVLSARNHEAEADIIAQAGAPGALTVATNMAGRGTDIVLGGRLAEDADELGRAAWQQRRDAVLAAGGLAVLGTEHHESRRVDNQLRGRSGRQGDPGFSQFFVSLEDTVLRVFGSERSRRLLAGAAGDAALSGPTVKRLVDQAQRTLEQRGFGERRELLQFDRVCAEQREAVYRLREAFFQAAEWQAFLDQALAERVTALFEQYAPEGTDEASWELKTLKTALAGELGVKAPLVRWVHRDELERATVAAHTLAAARERLAELLESDPERARLAVFDALDELWSDHLSELEELRSGMGLQGHAGQNPMSVFANQAHQRFEAFGRAARQLALQWTMRPDADGSPVQFAQQQQRRGDREARRRVEEALQARWVLRTEPCPCGSGKRFKACHGRLE